MFIVNITFSGSQVSIVHSASASASGWGWDTAEVADRNANAVTSFFSRFEGSISALVAGAVLVAWVEAIDGFTVSSSHHSIIWSGGVSEESVDHFRWNTRHFELVVEVHCVSFIVIVVVAFCWVIWNKFSWLWLVSQAHFFV